MHTDIRFVLYFAVDFFLAIVYDFQELYDIELAYE